MIKPVHEFCSGHLRGDRELTLQGGMAQGRSGYRYRSREPGATHIQRLRIERFIPCRVEIADPAGEIGLTAISRLDIARILGDAIVVGVKGFNEVLVMGWMSQSSGDDECVPCTASANILRRSDEFVVIAACCRRSPDQNACVDRGKLKM